MSFVSDLRQYRFKKAAVSDNISNGMKSNTDVALGRKRIRTPVDSSEEDEGDLRTDTHNKIKQSNIQDDSVVTEFLTVKDKESRLRYVSQNYSTYESLDIQDALVRCKWNVVLAEKYLKENCSEKTKAKCQQKPQTSLPPQSSSQIKYELIKEKKYNDNESDDDGQPKEQVFDSDDDCDMEISKSMSKYRLSVFEFMNNSAISELLAVKTCSIKKAEAIMELRPFKNWNELVNKIQKSRNLSTELLNYCQDLLTRRNHMINIMKKCSRLVEKLEAAVSSGYGELQSQPMILDVDLRLTDYQLVGLNWLVIMHEQKMNGILADEMGLGKTIQIIAFLAYLKETSQSTGAHLIVVPSSTLDNWYHEILKWCPSMVVERYYGSASDRRQLRFKYARNGLEGIDILLSTYHTVASSPEERKMFRVMKLHYVIFDEAHMLKNMTTQRYSYLARINGANRILLTGTPLQNNLLELISLLVFVMPSLFASKAEDIKTLFQKTAKTNEDEEITSFEQKQIDHAKRIMKPFVLRRLKRDVLSSLPKKYDNTIKVSLTPSQKEQYTDLVRSYSSESGIVKATMEQSGSSMMMNMRKLANHPLLLRYYYTDETLHAMSRKLANHPMYKRNRHPQYIFEDLAILSDFKILQIMEKYDIIGYDIPDAMILNAGKFFELDKLLPKLKMESHRVLLFSQFTMMLDVLERYLDIRGYEFLRFDGQTAVDERQDLIDKFTNNTDIFVFLLSTRAGGLGINLTAADTVIIYDIDFNPYNDKQAEDRSHRIGQTKSVNIYRLISEGTIEEGMLHIAKEKLKLEREVTHEKADDDVQEHKCMVRLLTMALGMDEKSVENMLSPSPKKRPLEQNGNNELL